MSGLAGRVAGLALLLSLAFASATVLHESAGSVASAPPLSVDDSIPNVAVTLAQKGRYGFLSSPTQGPNEVDRTYAFYNYGPAYFVVAAALVWLVGPSLELFRLLHPLGLIAVVVMGAWTVRRASLAGAAVLGVGLFGLYLSQHVPVARPDVIVSVCAAAMLAAAAHAIATRRWTSWALTGFFAGTAATSHFIAASMVPAAAVIWLLAVIADRCGVRHEVRVRTLRSFSAIVVGGIAALAAYLVAIDFRVADVLELGRAGLARGERPFAVMVADYFWAAWDTVGDAAVVALSVGFAGAAAAAVVAVLRPRSTTTTTLALVMPPVTTAIVYQVMVGFYSNVSTGYVILSQVTTLWAVSAAVSVIVARMADRCGRRAVFLHATALGLAATVTSVVVAGWLTTPNRWETEALRNTDFTDYISEVLAPLPERAAVWGTLAFGVDAGDRSDLVQFQQAFNPALDTRPERRDRVVPDFLALGAYELHDAAALTFVDADSALGNFFLIFPDARYDAVKLVSAPSYGTTIVYRRRAGGEGDESAPPAVAVNDGTGRQWSARLSDPLPVRFETAADISAELRHYSIHATRTASATRMARLPVGFYLLELEIARDRDAQTGFILASPRRHFTWTGNDPALPVAPFLVGSRRIAMLVDHASGGPLYLGRFERRTPGVAASAFEVVSTRRVLPLEPPSLATERVAIAPLGEWSAGEKQDERYSPWLTVDANRRMMFVLPLDVLEGDAILRVVGDRDGQLAALPLPARVTFDTRASTRVRFELKATGRVEPLGPGTLVPLRPRDLYVDRLMACRSPYIRSGREACAAAR